MKYTDHVIKFTKKIWYIYCLDEMIYLIVLNFGLTCSHKALNIKYYESQGIWSNIPIKELITSHPFSHQLILKFMEKTWVVKSNNCVICRYCEASRKKKKKLLLSIFCHLQGRIRQTLLFRKTQSELCSSLFSPEIIFFSFWLMSG